MPAKKARGAADFFFTFLKVSEVTKEKPFVERTKDFEVTHDRGFVHEPERRRRYFTDRC